MMLQPYGSSALSYLYRSLKQRIPLSRKLTMLVWLTSLTACGGGAQIGAEPGLVTDSGATIAAIAADSSNIQNSPVVSNAEENSVSRVSLPAQAIMAGVKALTFHDEFDDIHTIDSSNTQVGGFHWYTQQWFGMKPVLPTQFSVANSVLTLGDGMTDGSVSLVSAISSHNSNHYQGNIFGQKPAYFEARIKFSIYASSGATGFPAFWALAIQHIFDDQETTDEHWPGTAPGYAHFAELDFMEMVHSPNESIVQRNFYQTTIHDWSGEYTNGSWPKDVSNGKNQINDANRFVLPKPLDSNWHIYGCLYVPTSGTTAGFVQWFYDNTAGQKIFFKSPVGNVALFDENNTNTWSPTSATDANSTYAILDSQQLALSLTTDNRWPLSVDWVRVWQP